MTIYFYKEFNRNPEIENTPVWVLPSISRVGQVRDTKFGTNVPNDYISIEFIILYIPFLVASFARYKE